MSSFTPGTRAVAIDRVRNGATLVEAARAAGIAGTTLKGWITRGNAEDLGPFRDFAAAIADARVEAQEVPPPMTDEQFRARLERSIRNGSVQAMKLWATIYATPAEPVEEKPVSAIARLADSA